MPEGTIAHRIEMIRVPEPIGYADMLDAQRRWRRAVEERRAPDACFLLEHTPVITLGRSAHEEHVLQTREDRGGDCHQRGQEACEFEFPEKNGTEHDHAVIHKEELERAVEGVECRTRIVGRSELLFCTDCAEQENGDPEQRDEKPLVSLKPDPESPKEAA